MNTDEFNDHLVKLSKASLRNFMAGSWNNLPRNLRSAERIGLPSGHRNSVIGFRVARTF